MSEINIIEQTMTPEKPKILERQEIELYMPLANYHLPGAASFDPQGFIVTPDGKVLLRRNPIRAIADISLNPVTGILTIFYDDGSKQEIQYLTETKVLYHKTNLMEVIEFTPESFYFIPYDETSPEYENSEGDWIIAYNTSFKNDKFYASVELLGDASFKTGTDESTVVRQGYFTVQDSVFKGEDGTVMYFVHGRRDEQPTYTGRILLLGGSIFTDALVANIRTDSSTGHLIITYIDGTIQEIDYAKESWVMSHINDLKSSLDTKVAKTSINKANGVAGLDSGGKIPSNLLPSYVDDIIEGKLQNGTFIPDDGSVLEVGKIYIDTLTNKTYRWSGSSLVLLSDLSNYYTKTETDEIIPLICQYTLEFNDKNFDYLLDKKNKGEELETNGAKVTWFSKDAKINDEFFAVGITKDKRIVGFNAIVTRLGTYNDEPYLWFKFRDLTLLGEDYPILHRTMAFSGVTAEEFIATDEDGRYTFKGYDGHHSIGIELFSIPPRIGNNFFGTTLLLNPNDECPTIATFTALVTGITNDKVDYSLVDATIIHNGKLDDEIKALENSQLGLGTIIFDFQSPRNYSYYEQKSLNATPLDQTFESHLFTSNPHQSQRVFGFGRSYDNVFFSFNGFIESIDSSGKCKITIYLLDRITDNGKFYKAIKTIPLVADEVITDTSITHDDVVVGYTNSIDAASLNKTPSIGERTLVHIKTIDNYVYGALIEIYDNVNEEGFYPFKIVELLLLHNPNEYDIIDHITSQDDGFDITYNSANGPKITLPIKGGEDIVVDIAEDNSFIEIHLADSYMQLLNKAARALVTPINTPTENELVGISTANDQIRIKIGNGLSFDAETNTLKATAEGLDGDGSFVLRLCTLSLPNQLDYTKEIDIIRMHCFGNVFNVGDTLLCTNGNIFSSSSSSDPTKISLRYMTTLAKPDNVANLSDAQTISGVKTFKDRPVFENGIMVQALNKKLHSYLIDERLVINNGEGDILHVDRAAIRRIINGVQKAYYYPKAGGTLTTDEVVNALFEKCVPQDSLQTAWCTRKNYYETFTMDEQNDDGLFVVLAFNSDGSVSKGTLVGGTKEGEEFQLSITMKPKGSYGTYSMCIGDSVFSAVSATGTTGFAPPSGGYVAVWALKNPYLQ